MKNSSGNIHPDAVPIVPTAPGRLDGRDSCVAGWRAVIYEWKETRSQGADLYRKEMCRDHDFFSITFATGTAKQTMQGRDMFFLMKEGWKWLVAADQFSPNPCRQDLPEIKCPATPAGLKLIEDA